MRGELSTVSYRKTLNMLNVMNPEDLTEIFFYNSQELSESCRGLISTAINSQHTQTETDDDDKPR